jgi:hypothetical protein
MPKPATIASVFAGGGAVLALYLLGVSPSERADWYRCSANYVTWIRSCWVLSATLAVAACTVLLLKRSVLRWEILFLIWPFVVFALFTLVVVFAQYFRW